MKTYYLGCPLWGQRNWVGEFFTRDARPAGFLRQYASVFNTVEGNTTFYGLPTEATVLRWREEAPASFRFCFKVPRVITHDKRLMHADAELSLFLERLAPLGDLLGPFFIQLPPSFGPSRLETLERFLVGLPTQFSYAIEVRHPGFFAGGPAEQLLDTLLTRLGMDRVCFDTRGLRSAPPHDTHTREAQRKKPDVPVRFVATGQRPFVRYIAHPEVDENRALLGEWADVLAEWLREGRKPYFFAHAPDDFYAPRVARLFHGLLAERFPVGGLPAWPLEMEAEPPEQLSLF